MRRLSFIGVVLALACAASTARAASWPTVPTAAERGYVDDVIEPRRTRAVLIDALEASLTKREQMPKRKHGNIPL